MPPRAALLHWPNASQPSYGHMVVPPDGTPVFFAEEVDGPFAQRSAHRGVPSEFTPGPIEVAATSTGDDGDLAHVEPSLLESFPGTYPNWLENTADAAGGGPNGMKTADRKVLSHVVEGVLVRVMENCTDPAAAQRALNALKRPFVDIELTSLGRSGNPAHGYWCELSDGSDVAAKQDLGEMLHGLPQGEHLLLRAGQVAGPNGHALAISVTRLSAERVQVNLFNPSGWSHIPGGPSDTRIPAIGKTVSIDDASAALTSLIDGTVERPGVIRSSQGRQAWADPLAGAPLAFWLREVDPTSRLQPTGLRMTPQKALDCGVEAEFAWLASVLAPADYKLVKAHTLNVLRQAAVEVDLEQGVIDRLGDRITSSLSGHAMATGS